MVLSDDPYHVYFQFDIDIVEKYLNFRRVYFIKYRESGRGHK